ncbi:MAG: hypothetical protein E7521_02815 [Ruminococcaceae bacterium]|nr:hypothetical protein [Oscillospiraceae bacterium]
MNNKKILALILAVLMMLATFAGCRKAGSDDSALSSVNSDVSINYSNVDIVEDNSEPESVVDTTSDIESIPTVNNNSSSTENTVSVEEPNTNTNPDGFEIYGSGTSADPYIDTPNADTHTVKTLTIPAGKSVFYSIYRVGGRILTINDTNAFVVCDGTKHSAQGGKVSFKVVDALASDAVMFEIGNTSSTDKNFTITFADEQGSMSNPTILKNAGSEVTLKLEDGDEVGHFYKYIAEQNGTLKFYLLSDATKGILLATNNRNSAQRSTESSEEGEVKTDSTGTYIELEVEKGDEIIINAGIKPNKRNKYVATEIKWLAKY